MSDHEWCRDTALLWASLGDILGRVVRLEGEMDAGQDDSASSAEGLRTERVTLEVTQRTESYAPLSYFDWTAMFRTACRGRLFDGESVRVVDEADAASTEAMRCMTKMRRERDAAIRERDEAREECERLRGSLAACDIISNSNTTKSLSINRRMHPDYDCAAVQCVISAVEREIALRDRVAELERAYSAECDARAQAHRELSDLAAAVRERESGEECDHSYAAQCREAAAARERADSMMPAKAAPAANAGAESNQEPVKYAVAVGGEMRNTVYDTFGEARDKASEIAWRGVPHFVGVVALYRQPQWEVAAPAAVAVGQEPVAWGVRRSDGTWWRDCRATRGEMLSVVTGGGDANNVVSPLYAGPSRGWLTAEERDLIAGLTDDDVVTEEGQNIAKALLARETPPKVKKPNPNVVITTVDARERIDRQWIAAIREAGGEVEE